MDLAEKAELMDRLRTEGRWRDATKFREEARLRAKKEGLPRFEAKSRVWREMADAYPPLSQQQIALLPAIEWLCMGGFPIAPLRSHEDSGETEEISLPNLWYGTCVAIASLHARVISMQGWFHIVEKTVLMLDKDPGNDQLRCVFALALGVPLEFLQGFALPRYEALLNSKREKTEDDLAEIRSLAEVLAALNPENLETMLVNRLG